MGWTEVIKSDIKFVGKYLKGITNHIKWRLSTIVTNPFGLEDKEKKELVGNV